ncbi:MAG: AbgT family transporter [Anaerolineaceae bacterium]|nr:AbgT family transporter [Anaerolineaceae bacterium]
MEEKSGAQISRRAFFQSIIILIILMISAGILTRVVPSGSYTRLVQGGRESIDPTSYRLTAPPDYPIWRWATAPLEVLAGPDGLTISVIIIFLLMVGTSFAVLDKSGILKYALGRLVNRFGGRKYVLLLLVTFFFMLIGGFFGIFEEVVPLVPIMIALAYAMGWDSLVGLGMSILATNMGFSAAVTNPFTIGVAQKIAGLPLFSGFWLRILIFMVIYAVLAIFLVLYARKIERNPETSDVYQADQTNRRKYKAVQFDPAEGATLKMRPVLVWLVIFLGLIVAVLIAGPLVSAISEYSLPLVGILFLAAGLGAGFLSGVGRGRVLKAGVEGLTGIAPAIPMILMASSIKFIVVQGGIMDTILHSASGVISQASSFASAVIIYFLALFIELFVASGSAKAFLMIPILLPIADLVGVTRQVAVTAYCFGDGFSNLAYPTNPVLLICLGLTVVSYPRWLKWTAKLWFWVLLVTIAFLGIGVAIHFGPF